MVLEYVFKGMSSFPPMFCVVFQPVSFRLQNDSFGENGMGAKEQSQYSSSTQFGKGEL